MIDTPGIITVDQMMNSSAFFHRNRKRETAYAACTARPTLSTSAPATTSRLLAM